VLASAIPGIFFWIVYDYRIKNFGFGNVDLTDHDIASIISILIELLLGLWFLLGSKGIVGMGRWLRRVGNE